MQGVADPVMAEGWAGIVRTITARVLEVPFPQVLAGVTIMFPEAAPVVTVIEFVP
jgi:hypothetical protein